MLGTIADKIPAECKGTPLDPNAFVSPERIDIDLKALSERFDCVRTYSQGFGLNAVPGIAQKYGMKVLMGIWLGRDPSLNALAFATDCQQRLLGLLDRELVGG